MTKYTLISFKLCPYVQRVAIALAEKGIPFDLQYVDLNNKPDWFTRISPLGKVPLLKVEDEGRETVLFESSVILEYLEDSQPEVPLHPVDPLARAHNRAWMEYGTSVLADIWSLEIGADQLAYETAANKLKAKLQGLERVLGRGPFFGGEHFSLVDAVFAPAFRYFDVFDRYTSQSLLLGFPKIKQWREVLARRSSVAGAVVPEYTLLLDEFLRDKNAWLLSFANPSAQLSIQHRN
jgi:glutathione S-transferase